MLSVTYRVLDFFSRVHNQGSGLFVTPSNEKRGIMFFRSGF